MGSAITGGLRGAFLLAHGRADGLQRVVGGLAGAATSFWAAAICLPAFACLRLLDWAEDGWPANLPHGVAMELLGYVIGWAGYALASRPLAASIGREERWPLFIAAWNWCNVVQYLLLLLATVPGLLGAPSWVGETAGLVALFWALWLEWYVTRLALQTGPAVAVAFVLLDVAIGVLLTGATGTVE